MRRISVAVLIAVFILVGFGSLPLCAEEPTSLSGEPSSTQKQPTRTCEEWLEMGKMEHALWACRDEFEASTDSTEAVERMAQLEYDHGEADRAAALFLELIEREGWSEKYSRARALALWRASDLSGAEKLMRHNLQEAGSEGTFNDLITFLLTFDRWDEAAGIAAEAATKYPTQCGYFELGAVAEAGLSNDDKAAALIKKAVKGGCPPFRWTTLGPLPEKKSQQPYLGLLVPTDLVEGIRQVDNRSCEMRLQLLRLVLTNEVAPQITTEILLRDRLEIRFEGLGLLSRLGSSVMDSWKRLLASDDFVLRKYTLRRIREIGDPAFIPLLETHLTKEDSPRNKVLCQLVLGELMLAGERNEEATKLLTSLPEDDLLYPVGLVALADYAESHGDIGAALGYLENALAANPEVYVDRDRLVKLRKALEESPTAGE